jgi:thioredoxin-like negative regulator of GroEL
MKRHILCLACLAVLIAGLSAPSTKAASSERIVVRAGEHTTFSRVLFPVKLEKGWSFDQYDGEIVVTLKGVSATFDTSAIHPRRAAHRVSNVTMERRGEDTVFRFQLACACKGSVYEIDRTRLVLDVAGPMLAEAAPVVKKPRASEPADDGAQAEAVERVRRRLVEQLRMAEEKGIVSFRAPVVQTDSPISLLPQASEEPEAVVIAPTGVVDQAAAPEASAMPAAPTPQGADDVAAEPAEQDPTRSVAAVEGPEMTASAVNWACREDSDFDPAAWQNSKSPLARIGGLRGQLVGEFDRPDDAAVLKLARHYLAVGMAAEAHALLSGFDIPATKESAFLLDIAATLDHRRVSPQGPLLGPGPCGGRHGVLQAFAHRWQNRPDLAVVAEVRSSDALQTLPRYLRSAIAAELALSAIEIGRHDQAARLIALAERSAETFIPEITLAGGLLALYGNHDAESEHALTSLIHLPGYAGTTAASRLAEYKLAKGEALPEDLLLALDGIAIEGRYTSTGREALILAARGLLRGGRALQAGERLLAEKLADREGRPQLSAALVTLLEQAARYPDRPDTLALLLAVLPSLPDSPTLHALKRETAGHLIANGLPEAAVDLVAADTSDEGRALLAVALIDAGRFDGAQEVIATLPKGAAKTDLRQRAHAAQGQYAALAKSIPDPSLDTIAELSWLGGDWAGAREAYARLSDTGGDQPDAVTHVRRAASAFMQGDPKIARNTANALKDHSSSSAALAAAPQAESALIIERARTRVRHLIELQSALQELIGDG